MLFAAAYFAFRERWACCRHSRLSGMASSFIHPFFSHLTFIQLPGPPTHSQAIQRSRVKSTPGLWKTMVALVVTWKSLNSTPIFSTTKMAYAQGTPRLPTIPFGG